LLLALSSVECQFTGRIGPDWRSHEKASNGTDSARVAHARRHHAQMTSTVRGTATQLKPLGSNVIVKPTPREEMTKSGIVLPDTAKERPQEGTVIAVGTGRTLDNGSREEIEVAVGQKVLFQKYAGTEFKLDDDDELLILKHADILAIVD
jgi:chaperonin GroES